MLWNGFLREVLEFPTLEIFKNTLNKQLPGTIVVR